MNTGSSVGWRSSWPCSSVATEAPCVGRDDGTTASVYVQNDQQALADYTAGTVAGRPTYNDVFASFIDEPVVRDGSGGLRYYHRNQQYSVTALADSSGTITERYAYTAYGQPAFFDGSGTAISASAEDNRYTYTGREWDDDLGLYHYRARMYDAVAGRFCSRDPIRYEGDFNLYGYVKSRPLHLVDPYGLKCTTVIYMGHQANVRENMKDINPTGCDRIGVICCFMDSTLKECEEEFGSEHIIPDWPEYDRLIYDRDLPPIFRDILGGVKASMSDACKDCDCETATVAFYCDDDIAQGMEDEKDKGNLPRNWCNWLIDMDCESGLASFRRNPHRLPKQPIRKR